MSDSGGPVLFAYRLAGHAAIPFLPWLLAYRTSKGKEDPLRRNERYGRAGRERPDGPLVWVHAASVGETNAILPLVRRIVDQGIGVLFTTVTVTGAATAAANLPQGAFHQYAPIDTAPFVARFLRFWRPGLAIFVESELWPSTMRGLAAEGIPHILANARMSERSFERWRRLRVTGISRLLGGVTAALAQSVGDGDRLNRLGVPAVTVTGNIKFDVPPPEAAADTVAAFREAVAGRELFTAASTHEGEDEIVADAHAIVRRTRPTLLTVIAPRHPVRGPAIRDALAKRGLKVALRSQSEAIAAETDIYVADTLGDLGIFYRVAPVAFIGGSFVDRGGHNPIEPVQLHTAILHGPHVGNWREIYQMLDATGSVAMVQDGAALAGAVAALLADPDMMRDCADRAAAALAPFAGALDRTMQALQPHIDAMTAGGGTRR